MSDIVLEDLWKAAAAHCVLTCGEQIVTDFTEDDIGDDGLVKMPSDEEVLSIITNYLKDIS